MDFKEIPVRSRQDNTKTLSEIKANLKKSLAAWEPLLNVMYDTLLVDELCLVRDIQIPIEKALEMIKQDNTEPELEKVFISVEGGNIDTHDMTDNVMVEVIEHDNKEIYIVQRDKEGKIKSRTAGKYDDKLEIIPCSRCGKDTAFESKEGSPSEGDKCCICDSWICVDCIDWACMAKTKTERVVCKECTKLFENCKGGN